MPNTIVGKQVLFGISDSLKTVSDTVISGIVQDASASKTGAVLEIQDEDGDHVTRIDHGKKNTISITVLTTDASLDLPENGAEVNFGAITDIDGIDVSTGRAFIDDATSSQAGGQTTSASYTISHYPSMQADA